MGKTINDEYCDAIDELLDKIYVYERDIEKTPDILKRTTEVDMAHLEDIIKVTIENMNNAGLEFKGTNAAYQLAKVLATAERFMVTNGHFETTEIFMNFLKYDLFKIRLRTDWIGYAIIMGLYKGAGITNTFVKEGIDYFDIHNPNRLQYEIDIVHLTNAFSKFILGFQTKFHYDGEEQRSLEKNMEQYERFRSYADRDVEEHRAEAMSLYKEIGNTWPALSYAIAEVFSEYDMRMAIAKNLVPDPKITSMRRHESDRHAAYMAKKAWRRFFIILLVIVGIIIFIGINVFHYFAGHPGRQGIAALAIIVIGISILMHSGDPAWHYRFWWKRWW